jgi:hypothetical protein
MIPFSSHDPKTKDIELRQLAMKLEIRTDDQATRRHYIGGSDARVIMGEDEGALLRLWREKRGEIEREDLSGNLMVQLGVATEHLNRRWCEAIRGGAPLGWYIATVCYAIAVISPGAVSLEFSFDRAPVPDQEQAVT